MLLLVVSQVDRDLLGDEPREAAGDQGLRDAQHGGLPDVRHVVQAPHIPTLRSSASATSWLPIRLIIVVLMRQPPEEPCPPRARCVGRTRCAADGWDDEGARPRGPRR